MLGQKSAIRPGSIFNRQGGSVFNQRQHSGTFNSAEALECRGIAFDRNGQIISRPLHKFFNVGEKQWLAPNMLLGRDDIAAVFEKLDGSMIATAWVDGGLHWRSKKSFDSEVVKLTITFLEQPENEHIKSFAQNVASNGMTAIFEITHPEAQIVVAQDRPALRLLHVRDNTSGQYVMLDPGHPIHALIDRFNVPMVARFDGLSLSHAMNSLDLMQGQEGYVIQFKNGDMVKLKCPWYQRLHNSVSMMRERDIARLALNEELDDVKGALGEVGIDLKGVNEVESRLKNILSAIMDEVDEIYEKGRHLCRKGFAIANNGHPLFGLAMQRYQGKEVTLIEWYSRSRLKQDFGFRNLGNGALTEAFAEHSA
ncbi:2'-5' RNA ligase [Pseudomonas gregormendelii]|uniref:2'-5' RNA ligase n=1 Tax=Pseudomonas gregormendelii TaxID=1628277 RepID=A0ABS3ANV7_9PSED|nr:RNA ligase [Pseudomonas gregormendelii]MBN3968486.1 2'-5' RNA ligase [Pseudomonas gregormendelii]